MSYALGTQAKYTQQFKIQSTGKTATRSISGLNVPAQGNVNDFITKLANFLAKGYSLSNYEVSMGAFTESRNVVAG